MPSPFFRSGLCAGASLSETCPRPPGTPALLILLRDIYHHLTAHCVALWVVSCSGIVNLGGQGLGFILISKLCAQEPLAHWSPSVNICQMNEWEKGVRREITSVRCRENSSPRLLPSLLCALPTQFCDYQVWAKLGIPWNISVVGTPKDCVRKTMCCLSAFVCVRIRIDFRKRTEGTLSSVDFVVGWLSKFQSVSCCLFSMNKCAAF